jgi:hypothetical protein
MQNDNDRLYERSGAKAFSKEAVAIHALQQEKLSWLGNVPIDKLIQLRERGEVADLRHLIGEEIGNIEQASDAEFLEVANQVNYNIDRAMKKHSAEISDFRAPFRDRYGLDISYYIVSGTFAIASYAFQPVASATGIITAVTTVLGPTFKTLGDYLDERSRLKVLQKKPVAMLFDAKNSWESRRLA